MKACLNNQHSQFAPKEEEEESMRIQIYATTTCSLMFPLAGTRLAPAACVFIDESCEPAGAHPCQSMHSRPTQTDMETGTGTALAVSLSLHRSMRCGGGARHARCVAIHGNVSAGRPIDRLFLSTLPLERMKTNTHTHGKNKSRERRVSNASNNRDR